jgi:polyhydroxyalkanoate synthase
MSPTKKSSPPPILSRRVRQRPLMLHLGLAAAAIAEPELQKGKNLGNEFWEKPEGRAAKATMEKVVQGIRLYQLHPYERELSRQSIVWAEGQVRLTWHAAKTKRPKARILVIPSMINGPEILDILPERSLLRWLADQGFDVFLLEWGNLCDDPALSTLDKAMPQRVGKCLDWLAQESDLPLFGLGYCMGGVLLAAAETLFPDKFKGLCFIATPWDFEAGATGNFAGAVQAWAKEDGLERVAHLKHMPVEWLQMLFAGVDPSLIARKFSAFADMDQKSLDARLFVAVEDWVNGGADLPPGLSRQAVADWYLDNKPIAGKWKIARKTVAAQKIDKPSLVVIPARDRIVPPESARPLALQIPAADILEPDCGHISMMVGRDAKTTVWKPLKEWMVSKL